MKKVISIIMLAVLLTALNVIQVFAEEHSEEIPDMKASITLYSEYDEVYVGEKIKITATVNSENDGARVKAIWMVNGVPVQEISDEVFVLQNGMQSELNYIVPPQEGLSKMSVSFLLYDEKEQLISSAKKTFKVNKKIPVSILSTTDKTKAYFYEKVKASVQLGNDTGRYFEYKAHWELNGQKIKGYENKHFSVGETASSACPITLSDFLGKKIKVTFVLDNGIEKISRDIEIDVMDYPPEVIYQRKVEEMRNTIKTVEIECELIRASNVYKDANLKNKTGYKEKGSKGIYVDFTGTYSAKVSFSDGTVGWVPYRNISISTKDYVDSKGSPDDELKEIFVNENGYESETKYLVWISLKFQEVNVFLGEKGNWKLVRSSMPCSTGKNTTPTISGVFKYFQYEKRWDFGKYYVAPVMRFHGGAALHSRTYKPDGSILDPTLGKPVSQGCVRLKQEDIDWLAYYIPLNTTVVVY